MPPPRKRFDPYGRPLPRLADPPSPKPVDQDFNRQQQAFIDTLLEQVYDAVLVPGIYAEVTLTFVVKDGTIMREMYTDRRERHRLPGEE